MLNEISDHSQRDFSQDSQIIESPQSRSDNSRLPNYTVKPRVSATDEGSIGLLLKAIIANLILQGAYHE